jgi:hypothetical protein
VKQTAPRYEENLHIYGHMADADTEGLADTGFI